MKRLVSISIGLLLLCGCAGRNPIEPPIPYADAGYSGGLKTLATIAAFYYDFGPITAMKANDAAAQMRVRVNWDCHRWGQFVEKVVLAIMEGRSQDAVLKDVHALNATYQCFSCLHGMGRVQIVNDLYTLYAVSPNMLPTTAELPEIEKAAEAQCAKKMGLN